MYSYYELSPSSGVLLYNIHHQLYARIRTGGGFARPLLLANDYHTDLSAVPYAHTLYYAYTNEQNTLLLKNIQSLQTLYTIPSPTGHLLTAPLLTGAGDHLLLLYISENTSDHTYRIASLLPFRSERQLPEWNHLPLFHTKPTLSVSGTNACRIISIQSPECDRYYLIRPELTITELSEGGMTKEQAEHYAQQKSSLYIAAMEEEYARKLAAMEKEYAGNLNTKEEEYKRKLAVMEAEYIQKRTTLEAEANNTLELSKAEYVKKLETMETEHNKKLAAAEADYTEKLTSMEAENKAQQEQLQKLSKEISRNKAIIQSASDQYNELMKVAGAYKEEALRRHSRNRKNS